MKSLLPFIAGLILLHARAVPPAIWEDAGSGMACAAACTDSSQPLRILNHSSLKRLPGVIDDLMTAFQQSAFGWQDSLDLFLVLDVQDRAFKNQDTSAAVRGGKGDTTFHVNLNRYYNQASDKALAATLIHEVFHCVLLEVQNKADLGDRSALRLIQGYNKRIMNPFGLTPDDFYDLMNRGDAGQHELMRQLFYPDMVSLLMRFARIHRQGFLHGEDAEYLMWSGLQHTAAYQKLNYEERVQIQATILREKGVTANAFSY